MRERGLDKDNDKFDNVRAMKMVAHDRDLEG